MGDRLNQNLTDSPLFKIDDSLDEMQSYRRLTRMNSQSGVYLGSWAEWRVQPVNATFGESTIIRRLIKKGNE